MNDWPLAAVRFALYGGLGLLFGLPFFTLTTRHGPAIWRMFGLGRAIAALAVIDLATSLIGFAMLVAQMSGTSLGQLDLAVAQTLIAQTALGWAVMVRLFALGLSLAIASLLPPGRAKSALLAPCGAIAVATLAWAGHGAADTGVAGLVHLGGDIVHLLAASAWVGALALLLALVSRRGPVTSERLSTAHEALAGFSRMGSVLVGLLILTGIANGAFTVGLSSITRLPYSTYGRLLIAKLLLFGGMLICAALNRFLLTPKLQAALEERGGHASLSKLRRSIALEAMLALLVLLLVAWFGMMEPPSS